MIQENKIRNDLVSAAFAMLCFPAALYFRRWADGPQENALFFLAVLFVAAVTSGYVTSLLTRISAKKSGFDFSGAARIGTRSGAITVLLGGGGLVSATSAHSLGLLTPPSEPIPPSFTLLAVALSALPAIFGGTLGAILVAPRRQVAKESSYTKSDATAEAPKSDRGLLPFLMVLSALSYLSPVAATLLKSDPPQEQPVVVEAPPPAPPLPPPFHYEKPPGFDDASPSLWTIQAQKKIENVLTDRPVTISPEEEFLFYCSRADRGIVLTVKRLDDFSTTARLPTSTIPRIIAWSSDSKRILLIDDSQNNALSVWDLELQRQIHLPLPTTRWLPKGVPIWWDDKEVVFYNERGHTWVSLETLRVQSIDTSPTWDRLDALARKEALAFPLTTSLSNVDLPSGDRFRMSQAGYIAAYARSEGGDSVLQTKHSSPQTSAL